MIELNRLYLGDCIEVMRQIPDNYVHLIVTSPPYNVGMDYRKVNDRKAYDEYLQFMERCLRECYRVLIKGGRIAINLPASILQSSYSRMAYLSLDIVLIMRKVGFIDREWITWQKMIDGSVPGKSTSWGSWCSPSQPYLRDAGEYIIVMDKEGHKRTDKSGKNDITREEFLRFTQNIWVITPENSHPRKHHPAPYPEELVYRLIKVYTWQGDIVLDPFVGSGTTAVVCKKTGRDYIGIDINEDYIKYAEKRIKSIVFEEQDGLKVSDNKDGRICQLNLFRNTKNKKS